MAGQKFARKKIDGTKICWKIDINSMQWTKMPILNIAREKCYSVIIGYQIYVFGDKNSEIEFLNLKKDGNHYGEKWNIL